MIILLRCVAAFFLCMHAVAFFASASETDTETGLIIDSNFPVVKKTCTVCHSARLILQNRADRDGWLETIRWMQEKQGLWQLDPETEKSILDYLANNYAPTRALRRPPLKVEWE